MIRRSLKIIFKKSTLFCLEIFWKFWKFFFKYLRFLFRKSIENIFNNKDKNLKKKILIKSFSKISRYLIRRSLKNIFLIPTLLSQKFHEKYFIKKIKIKKLKKSIFKNLFDQEVVENIFWKSYIILSGNLGRILINWPGSSWKLLFKYTLFCSEIPWKLFRKY